VTSTRPVSRRRGPWAILALVPTVMPRGQMRWSRIRGTAWQIRVRRIGVRPTGWCGWRLRC